MAKRINNPELFRPQQLRRLRKIKDGATEPYLFEAESGIQYVGKSDDGTRPLLIANELAVSQLAILAGLSTPRCFVEQFMGKDYFLSEYVSPSIEGPVQISV